MYFPRQNTAIPLPLSEEKETPQGATLSQDEIIEQVKKGEIKLRDMTISEREKYRGYAKNYGK